MEAVNVLKIVNPISRKKHHLEVIGDIIELKNNGA